MNALAHVALVFTGSAALIASFLYLIERATTLAAEEDAYDAEDQT